MTLDLARLDVLDQYRKTIRTAHDELSYLDVGAGAPTLFLHGVGTSSVLWRHVISALELGRRCLALDLPLHGGSPARAGADLSIGAFADVVADFCDALGLDAVDLVAHDTGGAVAQVFAARHPQRLRTFVLTNCDTHDNVPPEAFAPTVELAKAGELAPSAPALLADLAMARSAVFAMGYERPDDLPLDVVRAYLEPVIGTPQRARRFEQLLAGLEPSDLLAVEPQLRRLEVPTLVVWAADDPFFELRWAYWLRDTIPGVTEVIEIPGAKLFFPDERGPELAGHLERHWAAHPAGGQVQTV
jgi:pimeloyl-ACP methyl ester carboxylesterase